jgi:hypothetical protein
MPGIQLQAPVVRPLAVSACSRHAARGPPAPRDSTPADDPPPTTELPVPTEPMNNEARRVKSCAVWYSGSTVPVHCSGRPIAEFS